MASYDTLNPRQKEAVMHTEGPLLILAGAGSGKTRVITYRIAHLIQDQGVNPWNILAITFTNKAAGEMRERVNRLIEYGAESVWVSTFHSMCVRILRRYIDYLGYDTNFTIYDSDDQRTLMRQILKQRDLDPKQFRDREILFRISSAKNELISPADFMDTAQGSYRERRIAELYQAYQTELKNNNALDFDDLIFKTVDLLRTNPEILNAYQERFRYIHVDEYQDTNTAQFELVALLARKYRNLCVVGDDDQSIYKFRGANINNILGFEHTFAGTKVVKLEENYRSTKRILEAANAVIHHNRERKDKTLWTGNPEGVPVEFCQYEQSYEEAEAIVCRILSDQKESGRTSQDYAVLYRTNAQSRLLEEKCVEYNLPYRLVGGVNFYQRKEIKDILAYLKTIANGADDLAAERIINVPKRGIGAATVAKLMDWALAHGTSFYQACRYADEVPGLGRAAAKVSRFVEQIENFRERLMEGEAISDMIEGILEETGYAEEVRAEGDVESQARFENLGELINKAVSYEETHEEADLNEFLEEVALVADVDRMDESENRVTLMTLHSAKGLEFPVVFLAGMEEGLFPGSRAINSDDPGDIEEERRLCYVGITRAKEQLIMTGARLRMTRGELHYSSASRFIGEIPEEMLAEKRVKPRAGRSYQPEQFVQEDLPWNQTQKKLNIERFGKRAEAPAFGKTFSVTKQSSLDYQEGDRVRHAKFGEGKVLKILDGAKDYEVTVDFDRAGVKKMFASFARLQKL
ncbi:MAG: DNA helicase PcrA [Clostridiales bacterium]|nr:DNA helicase PcrA [Clostridiales bacterium]